MPETPKRGHVALERALSKLGLATRSDARALIVDGRVHINGRLIRDPLLPVVPERVRIEIDAQPVDRPAFICIALHKPRGVVTTRRDPQGRPTVYDLLGDVRAHLIPVGRLDFATSGLILFTNDTRFADWLTDPANEVRRVYLATVRGRVSDVDARQLEAGVRAGADMLSARSVTVRKASTRESHVIIELVEGKNREVRRMLKAVGHEVMRLRRVQFGGVTLDDLPLGAWRDIDAAELARAFPGAVFSQNKLRQSSHDR